MDRATLRAHYGSIRERDGQVFVLEQHGPNARPLQNAAGQIDGAFVTWEGKGLVLPGGKQVGARYALWVPAPILPSSDDEPDEPPEQPHRAPAARSSTYSSGPRSQARPYDEGLPGPRDQRTPARVSGRAGGQPATRYEEEPRNGEERRPARKPPRSGQLSSRQSTDQYATQPPAGPGASPNLRYDEGMGGKESRRPANRPAAEGEERRSTSSSDRSRSTPGTQPPDEQRRRSSRSTLPPAADEGRARRPPARPATPSSSLPRAERSPGDEPGNRRSSQQERKPGGPRYNLASAARPYPEATPEAAPRTPRTPTPVFEGVLPDLEEPVIELPALPPAPVDLAPAAPSALELPNLANLEDLDEQEIDDLDHLEDLGDHEELGSIEDLGAVEDLDPLHDLDDHEQLMPELPDEVSLPTGGIPEVALPNGSLAIEAAGLQIDMEDQPASRKKTRRPGKTTKYKNITRIDHPPKKTYGYFVRVQWAGEKRSKFFSDAKYGDRLGALAAAIEWRDSTERELGKPRTERQVVGKTRGASGIIGVRKRLKEGSLVYEATWVENGKVHRTSYSVAKHGERKARALAVRIRKQKEQERLRAPRVADEKPG